MFVQDIKSVWNFFIYKKKKKDLKMRMEGEKRREGIKAKY